MKSIVAILALFLAMTVTVAQESLVLSELLYQPHSGEAEYVELYNNTAYDIDIADYHIVRWVGDSLGTHYPLPHHTVAAHDYVVLTKDAASVANNYSVHYLANVVQCNLPTYPNNGGSVVLCTADSTIVEKFDYNPAMHSRQLRNKAGVSLERRRFNRPVNEEGNWFSASSVCGYGTPGYENSQSIEYLVEESCFDFSSTLLSPNDDGFQDNLEIEYRLDDGSLAACAEIYDATGRMVRCLLNNGLLGTHGMIQWDGRNDNGTVVQQGHYVLSIVVYDLSGKTQVIRRTIALLTY